MQGLCNNRLLPPQSPRCPSPAPSASSQKELPTKRRSLMPRSLKNLGRRTTTTAATRCDASGHESDGPNLSSVHSVTSRTNRRLSLPVTAGSGDAPSDLEDKLSDIVFARPSFDSEESLFTDDRLPHTGRKPLADFQQAQSPPPLGPVRKLLDPSTESVPGSFHDSFASTAPLTPPKMPPVPAPTDDMISLPPTTNTLTTRERNRLIKRARKLGQMLGETPQHNSNSYNVPVSAHSQGIVSPRSSASHAAQSTPDRRTTRSEESTPERSDASGDSNSSPPSLWKRRTNKSIFNKTALASPTMSLSSLSPSSPQTHGRAVSITDLRLTPGGNSRVPVFHHRSSVDFIPASAPVKGVKKRRSLDTINTVNTFDSIDTFASSATAQLTPPTPTSPVDSKRESEDARRRSRNQLAKLSRHLGENVPVELVRPSLKSTSTDTADTTKPGTSRGRIPSFTPLFLSNQEDVERSLSPPGSPKDKGLPHGRSKSMIWPSTSSPTSPTFSRIANIAGNRSSAVFFGSFGSVDNASDDSERRRRTTSTTGPDFKAENRLTSEEKALNVRRALKMAQVFGTPPPLQLYQSATSVPGHGPSLDTAANIDANVDSPSPPSPIAEIVGSRLSYASLRELAYMIDHDRDGLYDMLDGVDGSDEEKGEDDSSVKVPVDWPYEHRTPSEPPTPTVPTPPPKATIAVTTASALPMPPPPVFPFSRPAQPRSDYPYLDSLAALSPLPTADDQPFSRYAIGFSGLEAGLSSSAPATSQPKPPPTAQSTDSHTDSQSQDQPRKSSDSGPDGNFQTRRRRAAKLSRFFGVGYHDLFHSLLVIPDTSPSDAVGLPRAPPPAHPRNPRRASVVTMGGGVETTLRRRPSAPGAKASTVNMNTRWSGIEPDEVEEVLGRLRELH